MIGWAAALTYEVFALLTGRQTMSAAVWKLQEHPLGRPLLAGLWIWLTAHLFRRGGTQR